MVSNKLCSADCALSALGTLGDMLFCHDCLNDRELQRTIHHVNLMINILHYTPVINRFDLRIVDAISIV